jgi:hypothetical protein
MPAMSGTAAGKKPNSMTISSSQHARLRKTTGAWFNRYRVRMSMKQPVAILAAAQVCIAEIKNMHGPGWKNLDGIGKKLQERFQNRIEGVGYWHRGPSTDV